MILLVPSLALRTGQRLQVLNCLPPSAAKNDNESCLRQFEHFCRASSASSGDRLLLDPAGEGEDILNEESTPPYYYNVGRRKQQHGKSTFQLACTPNGARPMRLVRPCPLTPQFPPSPPHNYP